MVGVLVLSHAVVGFAGGLLTAGAISQSVGGRFGLVYLSLGGLLLLGGLFLLVRDLRPHDDPIG